MRAPAGLERHEATQTDGADVVVPGGVAHDRHPVTPRRGAPQGELVTQLGVTRTAS